MTNAKLERMAAKLQKQAAKETTHSDHLTTRIINVVKSDNGNKLVDKAGHFIEESLEKRFPNTARTSSISYLFEALLKHPQTDQLGLLRLEEYAERDAFNTWLEEQPSFSEDALEDEYIDPNPLADIANQYAELLKQKQQPNEEEREMLHVDKTLKALQKYFATHAIKDVPVSNYIISGDLPDNYCHYVKNTDDIESSFGVGGMGFNERNQITLATEEEAYTVIKSLPSSTVLVRYRNSSLLPKLQKTGVNAVELIDIG